MSLYYLILWNQVDILQKHFKKDHVHMRPLDEVLRYFDPPTKEGEKTDFTVCP